MIFKILVILQCSIIFSFNFLIAQETGEAGQAAEFMRYGVGGRALAMGGAYGSIAKDASAGFWNPAALSYAEGLDIIMMKTWLSFKNDFSYFASAKTCPINSYLNFGLAASWASLHTGGYEFRDENTNFIEKFGDTQNGYLFTISCGMDKYVKGSLGTNFSILTHSVLDYAKTSYSMDVGLLVNLSMEKIVHSIPAWLEQNIMSPLWVGYSAYNVLNSKYELKNGDEFEVARYSRFSLAWEKPRAINLFDLTFSFDRLIFPSRIERSAINNAGFELKYDNMNKHLQISARLGARNLRLFKSFTYGLGIKYQINSFIFGIDPYFLEKDKDFSVQKDFGIAISFNWEKTPNKKKEHSH